MPEYLFYSGRVNAISGESGGGKTWVALAVAQQYLAEGRAVMMIDLEDHISTIYNRLKLLGATPDQLKKDMYYIKPHSASNERELANMDDRIRRWGIELVIIDSVGELLSLEGANPNKDEEVARVYRNIPRRFAALGPCVLLIDHVPKEANTRGSDKLTTFSIGSQRKRSAIDGAAFMTHTIDPFARGVPGSFKLVTAKDRQGNYRAGQPAADIRVTFPDGPDGMRLVMYDVDEANGDDVFERQTPYARVRRTGIMKNISVFLSRNGPSSTRAILEGIDSQRNYVLDCLHDLHQEGWVRVDRGSRSAKVYSLLVPFDEAAEPPASRYTDDAF